MAPTDDASDPLVIQPSIQCIGRQLNTLQLNKWNPERGRWTGLRRHGLNWTVGSTLTGPSRITEDVKLQVPDRVPKYQSDRIADRRLNPQENHNHYRRDDNSRDAMQTSSSHQEWDVLVPSYESKELSSARWPARTRDTRERVRHATVWKNWVIANRQIAGTIFRSKMDKYRCTDWAHNALTIGIYLTIN